MGYENEPVAIATPPAAEIPDNWQNTPLRPEQVEALLTISTLLNSDLNAGRVLRDLLLQLCSLFRANRSAVFLREKLVLPPDQRDLSEARKQDIGRVICAASTGLTPEYLKTISSFYENKEFRQLQSLRRPIYIEDARHDTRLNGLRDINQREGFQTMLTLPLMYHDTLIGVMILYHDQPHHYTAQDTRLLSVFANQAALAITNARLYEAARNREREAARLAEVGTIFNASLRTGEVLNRVVRATGEMVGNTSLVYIIQEQTDEANPVAFYSRAAIGGQVRLTSPVKTGKPLKLGGGVVGKALQNGVPFIMLDNAEILRSIPFVAEQDGVNSLICVPLKSRGRIIGVLITYQVTYGQSMPTFSDEQMTLAQALADRAAPAIENARLYEAEKREQRVKDEFLTLVSHELNTPLTNIKGFNHLLTKKLEEAMRRASPEQPTRAMEGLRHYTDVIGSQIDRLQTLIADLSKIPLIETGQLILNLESIELMPFVEELVAETRQNLQSRPENAAAFNFTVVQRKPNLTVWADRAALTRIIQNLLSNAVKFSPSGGLIKLDISESGSGVVKLVMTDPGLGISDHDLPHIFERFYKTSSHPGRANGLGIGLYISRSLAEAMQGQLTANSNEGRGSVFTLRLPTVLFTK